MSAFKRNSICFISCCSLALVSCPGLTDELSVSLTVQNNLITLKESNSCPQCDLSGANLNRMELSGANLEGADLSRVRFHLSDLSGANLRDTNLREAGFGGADLADADLRGADLRGTSFAGAYIKGAIFDGEMVTTTPYADKNISDLEEKVYVEDTVKAKPVPETDELSIGKRRDFEETPPALPVVTLEAVKVKKSKSNDVATVDQITPQMNVDSPAAKKISTMQQAIIPVAVSDENFSHEDAIHNIEKSAKTEFAVLEDSDSKKVPVPVERTQEQPGTQTSAANDLTDAKNDSELVAFAEVSDAAGENKKNSKDEELLAANNDMKPQDELLIKTAESQVGASEIVETTTVTGKSVESIVAVNLTEELIPPTADIEKIQNLDRLLDMKKCYQCDLAGVDLQGADLEGADLEGANLSNTNLSGSDLEAANLKGAILIGANLSGADLEKADFYKADLTGAILTGADFENALFDDAVMIGVEGYQKKNLLMLDK